jgi:hypothetical protein
MRSPTYRVNSPLSSRSSPPRPEVRDWPGKSPYDTWRSGGIRLPRTRRARWPSSSRNSPRTPCGTAAYPDATSASGSPSKRRRAWFASRSRTRPPRNGPQRPRPRQPLTVSQAEGCSWWTPWPSAGVRRPVTPWARRYGRTSLLPLQLADRQTQVAMTGVTTENMDWITSPPLPVLVTTGRNGHAYGPQLAVAYTMRLSTGCPCASKSPSHVMSRRARSWVGP